MLLALICSQAYANELPLLQEEAPTPAETAPAAGPEGAESAERPFLMEINARGRYLSVPDSILDIPYYNSADNNGSHLARPSVRAYSVGLEFVLRSNQNKGSGAMGAFYFDYFGPLMETGYWDDREKQGDGETPNYLDGEMMGPAQNFGIMAIGANYYYDLRLAPWFSFVVGGGLGGMYIIGDMETWEAAEGVAAYNRDDLDTAEPDGQVLADNNIPKLLPVIDINMGVKFHFNDRASLRIEGGLHNMLYAGAAVGVVF